MLLRVLIGFCVLGTPALADAAPRLRMRACQSSMPVAPQTTTPRYFIILFGGQSIPFRPRTAHTWATFVKATPTPDGTPAIESFTISWLPYDGDVHPSRIFCVVEGRNFTLEETLALAFANKARVSHWGPYEISADWYARAENQKRLLESGSVRYRVLDSFGFNMKIMHCVRAVIETNDVIPSRPQPVFQIGEPGTSRVARRYLRHGEFLGNGLTHPWVISAIGLDQYPIVKRRSGEFIRYQWFAR